VMVNVYPPVGVFLPVDAVSVEVFGDGGKVNEVGFSVQVLDGGQPVTLRLTVPLKPFWAVTVEV